MRRQISEPSISRRIFRRCTFVKLELRDAAGELLSSNFYWLGALDHPDDLTALNSLPMVTLTATAEELEGKIAGQRLLAITLHNPTQSIALMAHVQLRRKSGERVLPVFYTRQLRDLAAQ